MRYLRNQNGIALVTALMFTMIILGIIMTLLYYVLAGTKMSAAQKQYRNSLEASYGGTEFITKAVIPRLFGNYSTGKLSLMTDFGGTGKLELQIGGAGTSSDAVLKAKLNSQTNLWTDPAMKSVNPKIMPDFIFTLKGTGTGGDFKVFSKIVDTVPGIGLIDATGIDFLDAGLGVAGTSTSTQTPRTPNMYSVEVQGEAAVNPKEKAGLSILYAY